MPKLRNADLRRDTPDAFLALLAQMPLVDIGPSRRAVLSEAARHLGAPDSSIGVVSLRLDLLTLYLTKVFDEDLNQQLREINGHKWNGRTKSDAWPIADAADAARVLAKIEPLFAKFIVLANGSATIRDGKGAAASRIKSFYKLHVYPMRFTLRDVFDTFRVMRPTDKPLRLYLHGEVDETWRAQFHDGVTIDGDGLDDILLTRHPYLFFRISVAGGKPRYLVYLPENFGKSPEKKFDPLVMFAGSSQAASYLAAFKDAHQALAHPLLEADAD